MILIINNYSKLSLKSKARKIANALSPYPSELIDANQINPRTLNNNRYAGVILSGSELSFSANIREKPTLMQLLTETQIPILGICFGCQALGVTFGGELRSYIDAAVRGTNRVQVVENDLLFHGWNVGDEIMVDESHRDYLVNLPKEFKKLATSPSCEYEAIRHVDKLLWGVQFHPERPVELPLGKKNHGFKILENFVQISKLFQK